MSFGATLRLLRLESGLSLRDLARRLGVSSTYLSRVENGLDPAPTPARLAHMARELGLPAPLLVELAQRVSPFLGDYLDENPEAGSLFLEIAHRRLDARDLAEVRAFLDAKFPPARAAEAPAVTLAELLEPDRVIVRLSCAGVGQALAMLAARLASGAAATELAAALTEREREASGAVGGGVAVVRGHLPGAGERAALATLAPALSGSIKLLVVLLGPPGVPGLRVRLARLARLAARGLADELAAFETPARVIAALALRETLRG